MKFCWCAPLRQGVFNTGVAFILMSWAVKRRGPIYPSMFNSLAMIATVIMDSVLIGTNIFLGRWIIKQGNLTQFLLSYVLVLCSIYGKCRCTYVDGTGRLMPWLICSILGTLLVIVGLYAFLWGKGKELQQAAAQNDDQKQDAANSDEQGMHQFQVPRGDQIA